MSLESAKKLGLSASIMWLIAPIVLTVVYVGLLFSIFSNLASVSGGASSTSLSNLGLVFIGSIGVIIAVGIVSIIALVFFLVAMYELSKYYNEQGIFRNILYAIIVSIVGSLATAGIFIALIFVMVGNYFSVGSSSSVVTPIFGFGTIALLVVATLVVSIVGLVFLRRAFCNLADKSGVEHFRTAGLLFLIGVFVPFVNYVALVFAALGYHRLAPTQTTPGDYTATPYVSSSSEPVKRCLHCGAENSPKSKYCRICGNPLS